MNAFQTYRTQAEEAQFALFHKIDMQLAKHRLHLAHDLLEDLQAIKMRSFDQPVRSDSESTAQHLEVINSIIAPLGYKNATVCTEGHSSDFHYAASIDAAAYGRLLECITYELEQQKEQPQYIDHVALPHHSLASDLKGNVQGETCRLNSINFQKNVLCRALYGLSYSDTYGAADYQTSETPVQHEWLQLDLFSGVISSLDGSSQHRFEVYEDSHLYAVRINNWIVIDDSIIQTYFGYLPQRLFVDQNQEDFLQQFADLIQPGFTLSSYKISSQRKPVCSSNFAPFETAVFTTEEYTVQFHADGRIDLEGLDESDEAAEFILQFENNREVRKAFRTQNRLYFEAKIASLLDLNIEQFESSRFYR